MKRLTMTVNGVTHALEVEDRTLLVTALREHLKLTGTHIGCDTAQCGACTIRLNGGAIKSCSILAAQADGAVIETIEGLAKPDQPMHPMQQAFKDCNGLQCGYCTPGMVMMAIDLAAEHPDLDRQTVVDNLDGNLCRCTGYDTIARAVVEGARRMRAGAATH